MVSKTQKIRWKFIFILFMFFSDIHAQNIPYADSLLLELNKAENNANKSDILWQLAKHYRDESPEKFESIYQDLLNLPSVQQDSSEYIKLIKYNARVNRKIGNYVKSIDLYRQVYNYFKHHKDSLEWALAADQIGIMNNFMGNMSQAQKYLLEAFDLYSAIGSPSDIADSNNGLAIFYSDMNMNEKAIERYEIALQQYEALDDTLGRANVHANLGLFYIESKDFDKAEYNLLMQGKLDSMIGTQWGLGFFHDFMGLLRKNQGRLDEAYAYHKKALEIRESLESHYNIAESRASLASVLYEMKRYDEAIFQAKAILEYEDEHQSLSQISNAYKHLSKIYEAKGDYKNANFYQKKYKIYSDSIYNRDMLEEITEKDALFKKAEQDNQILLLEQKNLINQVALKQKNRTILMGGIGLIFISLFSFFLFRLYSKVQDQRTKLSKALDEKDLLLREIHHRVKNNLQLVSSLLNLQSRSIDNEVALKAINDGKARVRSMALIHQDLYNRENLTGISVKHYLEKLTEELYVTYSINPYEIELILDIDDLELDVDTVVPLGLIINELITNSLKYAFSEGQDGQLSISLKENNNNLLLKVQDSGKGYNPDKVREKSFGNKLINTLTKQLGGAKSISFEKGTKVEIVFPKEKKKGT